MYNFYNKFKLLFAFSFVILSIEFNFIVHFQQLDSKQIVE